VYSFLATILCFTFANAQDYNFVEIVSENTKAQDLSIAVPESFTQIEVPSSIRLPMWMRGAGPVFINQGNAYISDDSNCIMLYSGIGSFPGLGIEQSVVDELRAFAGDLKKDVTGKYQEIRLRDMSNYSNADAVFIANSYQPKPFIAGYNNCIIIAMEKYAHPTVKAWILLNEEGAKDKDKYIRMFLDNITFGDTPSYLLKLHAVSSWAFQYRWIPPKNIYSTVVRGFILKE
ncbi:MAG: hypothetical protein K2J74_04090, partial [Muribaculaceae bacterium]|nr:hypothetical protein [Muribaculaceae bacterium]